MEALFGGLLGGVLRFLPEVLKFFDRKGERAHELAMLEREMEFAKMRGEIEMRKADLIAVTSEVESMGAALTEQGATARAAGQFVAAISALVRPLVTYWFVVLYSLHKLAAMAFAYEQQGSWRDVLISTWTQDDWGILSLILTFWFVGRVWERSQKNQTL